MDLYDELGNILFKIGTEVKVHKLPDGNLILDIDYDRYIEEILCLFDDFLDYQEYLKESQPKWEE
jgi:hypothetical protein